MTGPDDVLRGVLRDLIPDYTGPEDPLPRVVASVRRRRVRQRALLAVGSVSAAAVVALGVPALVAAGPAGGQAAAPGGATGAPTASGSPGAPRPEPTAYRVARGSIGSAEWEVGSVALEAGARRCLVSDDDLFDRDTACFDHWKAGGPVTWAAQQLSDPAVTRVVGVAPSGTVQVRVRLTDGTTELAAAVRTPTDRAARFFGLVLPGEREVRDVTALSRTGTQLGPPVGPPGAPPCVPGPAVGCATG